MKEKRTKVLLYPPKMYGIQPEVCPHCSGTNITWSEYKTLIACCDCNEDIEPTCDGVLDGGPVGVHIAALMGIRFDTLDLNDNTIEWSKDLPVPYSDEWRSQYRDAALEAYNSEDVRQNFEYIDNVAGQIEQLLLVSGVSMKHEEE